MGLSLPWTLNSKEWQFFQLFLIATGGFENAYEDHVMLLNLRETRLWVSPHYFDVEEKKYNASRLTVVAPPECRIVLTCNVPLEQGTGIPEVIGCQKKKNSFQILTHNSILHETYQTWILYFHKPIMTVFISSFYNSFLC